MLKSCRCFSSRPDSLKGEEAKARARLLVSLSSVWHWGPVAPFLLVLLPALVTPVGSLHAQCCMGLDLWVLHGFRAGQKCFGLPGCHWPGYSGIYSKGWNPCSRSHLICGIKPLLEVSGSQHPSVEWGSSCVWGKVSE